MTTRCPRRLASAEFAIWLLDNVPAPDQPPMWTTEIAQRMQLAKGSWRDPRVYTGLHYLRRRGLVEQVDLQRYDGCRYWRKTRAGARWDGSPQDLARPVRDPIWQS